MRWSFRHASQSSSIYCDCTVLYLDLRRCAGPSIGGPSIRGPLIPGYSLGGRCEQSIANEKFVSAFYSLSVGLTCAFWQTVDCKSSARVALTLAERVSLHAVVEGVKTWRSCASGFSQKAPVQRPGIDSAWWNGGLTPENYEHPSVSRWHKSLHNSLGVHAFISVQFYASDSIEILAWRLVEADIQRLDQWYIAQGQHHIVYSDGGNTWHSVDTITTAAGCRHLFRSSGKGKVEDVRYWTCVGKTKYGCTVSAKTNGRNLVL